MKTKANKTVTKARKKQPEKVQVEKTFKGTKTIVSTVVVALVALMINQINFDSILPIKKIRAQGEFENVTEKMILDAIKNDVIGGYLKVNVHKLQAKIEQLAWVKVAAVKRVWPDSIVVTIKEQKAQAIWKNTGLLNELGEKFKPVKISELELPVLSGPENLNVKVMNEYKFFESQLNKIDLSINEFNLDDRRAIYINLTNNIKISLGRSDYQLRLKRFITAYDLNLKKYSDKIEYVDMRYTNGFSIKWKENTQAAQAENILRGVLDV